MECKSVYCPEEEEQLVSAILDIGETLLTSGAEVNRVEDTIRRIGAAYELSRVEIFTITNSMVLTIHAKSGRIITQTRRITSSTVDLEKVGRLNNLSRSICKNPIPLKELQAQLFDIENNSRQYNRWFKVLAYIISASSFTVFFGGGMMDALVSAITAVVIFQMSLMSSKLKVQPVIANLVNAFFMTLAIAGMYSLGMGSNFDTIIMGDIMLLIPGINLTTSIRDIITGDTVSGLMGMCDALLKAFAIAVGCVAVMFLTGIV